jgi:signal transduction histidine kinase
VHELRWRLHDVTERKQAEVDLRQSRQTLRELSGRHEAVREEERATVARAVHDEIGAALTAIKMDLAQIRHGLDKLADGQNEIVMLRERTETAAQLIDETMQKVRSIAMELRPAILDDFGLVAALDWQLNEFQKRSGLRCELSVAPGDGRLSKATATAVFRVFQEILTNVARHAAATAVKVNLRQEGADLVLDVRDNGRGIREAEVKGAGSLGLVGMRERVRLQAGTVEVTGKPGTGTLVRVRVPVGDADPGAPPAGG